VIVASGLKARKASDGFLSPAYLSYLKPKRPRRKMHLTEIPSGDLPDLGRSEMEYRIIKNFEENPIEIFDGFEPEHLFLTPEVCGLDRNYQKIDLLDEINKKYQEDEVGLKYKRIYDELPTRVMAFNKSIGRNESVHGYFAIMGDSQAGKQAIILFSYFEVSPLRYHAYIHLILEEE